MALCEIEVQLPTDLHLQHRDEIELIVDAPHGLLKSTSLHSPYWYNTRTVRRYLTLLVVARLSVAFNGVSSCAAPAHVSCSGSVTTSHSWSHTSYGGLHVVADVEPSLTDAPILDQELLRIVACLWCNTNHDEAPREQVQLLR